jgi:hypothetical protein
MKKAVKIAIISAAAVAAAAGALFVAIPLATSKEAEARLGEALAEAGIPEDMWSVDRAYYVPLLGHLVVEKLKFGESGGNDFFEAKKVTLALDTGREDFFAGSVDAQGVSFSADDTGITVKTLSVNGLSVDKALFEYSPVDEVTKFVAKPGKFEIKTNIDSPVNLEEIGQNPLAMNLSLSINGGKPFTTGGR